MLVNGQQNWWTSVINGERIVLMTVGDFKESNRENWLMLQRGTTKKKREGSLKIKQWDCKKLIVAIF